jgi:excisionase family DNA binding protein
MASMPANGGRARSNSSFKTVTRMPAAPTAPSAANVARGRHRLRQSPAAAISAKSGHFTHQADARTSASVTGSHRRSSPSVEAAPSHARTISSTADKARRIAPSDEASMSPVGYRSDILISTMARPRKEPEDTAAIFARIPRAEADKLERLSFELRRPKQQIIAGLLAQYAPGDEPHEDLPLGRYAFRSSAAPEVLTLEQLARFLQVEPETVRALAEAGKLPGREVGGEWRFSREAVLSWLAGESG